MTTSAPDTGVRVPPGATATVRVPATSANLGPGFDSLGLALGIHDVVSVTCLPPGSGTGVDVEGEGAHDVPRDGAHLVVRAVRAGLAAAGVPAARQPDLRLSCRNEVPHGRGLGSSAAAVVAGLVAARGLLPAPEVLDDAAVLRLATRFEGHPDNAAAALLGGCTVSWTGADGPRAERIEIRADLDPVVCVPAGQLPTGTARAMLPAAVPHADAAFTAARAALLVHALTRRPSLLLEATQDRLHQDHRAPAMPQSAELIGRIRAIGGAAVLSGAGPAVMVLGTGNAAWDAVTRVLAAGSSGNWRVVRAGVDTSGAALATEGDPTLR